MQRCKYADSLSHHTCVRIDFSVRQMHLSGDHSCKKPCSHTPAKKTDKSLLVYQLGLWFDGYVYLSWVPCLGWIDPYVSCHHQEVSHHKLVPSKVIFPFFRASLALCLVFTLINFTLFSVSDWRSGIVQLLLWLFSDQDNYLELRCLAPMSEGPWDLSVICSHTFDPVLSFCACCPDKYQYLWSINSLPSIEEWEHSLLEESKNQYLSSFWTLCETLPR